MTNLEQKTYPIKGFEKYYYLTENFRLIHRPTNKEKKPVIDNHTGYYKFHLWQNNIYKSVYLHRLIAEIFIPNPEGKKYVNHIDGNKLNNTLLNLEWVTCKENIRHYLNDLSGKYRKCCYHPDYGIFLSYNEAAIMFNTTRRSINHMMLNQRANKTPLIPC